MKMQGKTAEQKQDSAKQDSVKQDTKHKLDNRYGTIGISAVAAAVNYVGDQQIPLHRLGTPDEVAKIIYVLCTETSSYVNGAEIHINGGQHV